MIRHKNRDGGPDFAKFPVIFPVSREFGAETGSQLTASSATQSVSISYDTNATQNVESLCCSAVDIRQSPHGQMGQIRQAGPDAYLRLAGVSDNLVVGLALRSEEGTWIARQCPGMARLPLMHQSSTTWRGRAAAQETPRPPRSRPRQSRNVRK